MKRTFFFFSVVLLLTTVFTACKKDQSTVKGTVSYTDKLTSEKKVGNGATVYLMTSDTKYYDKTVADGQGNYSFTMVPDGSYHVEAELSTLLFDYSGKTETFSVKGDDEVTEDLIMSNKENVITGQAIIEINGDTYTSTGVTVYVYNHGENTYLKKVNCDEDGYYSLTGLADGTYDIDADYTDDNGDEYYGYKDNISLTGGETKTIDLVLE